MDNKRKYILLVVSLVVLILTISSVSANDINQTTDNTQIEESSDIQQNTATEQKQLTTTKEVEKKKTIKEATYTVTADNYGRYFDQEDGSTTKNIKENDTVILTGIFENKNFMIDKAGVNLIGSKDSKIINGKIEVIDGAKGNILANLTINSTGLEQGIFNEADDVIIENNTIRLVNKDILTEGIVNLANNVIIRNNNVTVEGPSDAITWGSGEREDLPLTLAIYNSGNNVSVTKNTVLSKLAEGGINDDLGTIDGIEIQGDPSSIANNINVTDNTVVVQDGRFVYAINALRYINNVTIANNKATSYSERYVDGIQIGNNAYNCLLENNTIYGYCSNTTEFGGEDESLAFGIITTCMGGGPSENMTVNNNKIILNSTIAYGIEVFKTHNSIYTNNKMNLTGYYSMGIGVSRSSTNTFIGNEINATGDSGVDVNYVVEDIRPANTGIQIQMDSDNSLVDSNTIKINDKGNNAKGVNVEKAENITVINNDLIANTNYGNNAVSQAASNKTTIANNTSPYDKKDAIITIQAPKSIDTGKTTTINLTITDTDKNPINGKAAIKINGLTLKDTKTNNTTITITKGKGTLTTTLAGYSGRNYTITAVFSKEGYNRAENTTNMTINKGNYQNITLKINATSEQTITINKTLKDTNGNTIYGTTQIAIKLGDRTVLTTKVIDGQLNAQFKVPYLPQGTNKLKIILGENYRYNVNIINSTATINKQNTTVQIPKITATPGKTINITAKLTNQQTKTNVISGKYIFKVNGQTIPLINENFEETYTTQNIENGQAIWTYIIPNSMKTGTYNITISYNGNTQSNPIKYTTPALTII